MCCGQGASGKRPQKNTGAVTVSNNNFQEWQKAVFEQIWKAGLEEHDELEGIGWEW